MDRFKDIQANKDRYLLDKQAGSLDLGGQIIDPLSRQIDGQMDSQINKWTVKQTNGQFDIQTDSYVNSKQTFSRVSGDQIIMIFLVDRQTEKQTVRQTNGQIERYIGK